MALRQFSASYGPCIWCGTVVVKKYYNSLDQVIKVLKVGTIKNENIKLCNNLQTYIQIHMCAYMYTYFVCNNRERSVDVTLPYDVEIIFFRILLLFFFLFFII